MLLKFSGYLKVPTIGRFLANTNSRSFARSSPTIQHVKKSVKVPTIKTTVSHESAAKEVPDIINDSNTPKISIPGDILPADIRITIKIKNGKIEKGADEGYGKITMKDGTVYVGELEKNLQHGYGVIIYANGSSYDGMWRDGVKYGQGKLKTPNGIVLEGEFRNGLSYKVKNYHDGALEEGTWVSGQGEGESELLNADGSVLKGEFRGGKIYNGSGVMKFVDGTVMEGTWVEGRMEGHGTIVTSDNYRYVGDLRKGRKHGYGTYTHPNGNVYEGDYVNDKKQGKGKLVYADGSVYEGRWLELQHGQGKLTTAKGVAEGEFKAGSMYTGSGVLLTPKGKTYVGEWKSGKFFGKMIDTDGTMLTIDGSNFI